MRREKPAERCYGACSVLGADDGNIAHGVRPSCASDSLPAPASPHIFRNYQSRSAFRDGSTKARVLCCVLFCGFFVFFFLN